MTGIRYCADMRLGIGGGGRIARGGVSVGRGGVRGGAGVGPFSVSGGSGGGGGGFLELLFWCAVIGAIIAAVILAVWLLVVVLAFSVGPVLFGFVPDDATRARRNLVTAALFVLGAMLCYLARSVPYDSDDFWSMVLYSVLLALGVGGLAARPSLYLLANGERLGKAFVWGVARSFVLVLSNKAFQVVWFLLTATVALLFALGITAYDLTEPDNGAPVWLDWLEYPPVLLISFCVIAALSPVSPFLLLMRKKSLVKNASQEWMEKIFGSDRYLRMLEEHLEEDHGKKRRKKPPKSSPSKRFFDGLSS